MKWRRYDVEKQDGYNQCPPDLCDVVDEDRVGDGALGALLDLHDLAAFSLPNVAPVPFTTTATAVCCNHYV